MNDAMIWINDHEVRIFHYTGGKETTRLSYARGGGANTRHGLQGVDRDFFQRVVEGLPIMGAVIITGPASTLAAFNRYVDSHRPDIRKRVLGVETVDQPDDSTLAGVAARFLKADSRTQRAG